MATNTKTKEFNPRDHFRYRDRTYVKDNTIVARKREFEYKTASGYWYSIPVEQDLRTLDGDLENYFGCWFNEKDLTPEGKELLAKENAERDEDED